MKIALCSTYVPFINGGARNIVEWLQAILQKHGHSVEIIYLPSSDAPDLLFQQMMAFRWINLESADRIICFRPQSHLIPHDNKIVWFIHHIRVFYDLWDSEYRDYPDDQRFKGFRASLTDIDNRALREAKKIYTNSQIVSDRLEQYNQLESEVLYPPVINPQRFYLSKYSNEVVCICRLEHHKRQHLLIEAMKHTRTEVRLRLSGASAGQGYPRMLANMISEYGLEDRVILDNRWISEEEKERQLADCLAAAYLPINEDSYGYPSLEASLAFKPIVTTTDSGGVLELVTDRINGYVVEPSPKAIAEAFDQLLVDRNFTQIMGKRAFDRLSELNISWNNVIEKILL